MATSDNDTGRPGGPAPVRIGDVERQRMTEVLQRHLADGRLDMPEYERRVEHATSAVYEQDLDGLLDDLPPIDEDGEPVGRGDRHGRTPVDGSGRREDDDWWSPLRTGRGGPAWGRWMFPFPLVALAVALVVATNGWILFPLLFLFFFSRGGACRPRHHHGREPRHRREHGRGHGDWDPRSDGRPQWPGRFEPSGDDRRM